jgi:hypothetical protein
VKVSDDHALSAWRSAAGSVAAGGTARYPRRMPKLSVATSPRVARRYRLRIVLDDVSPPIWRDLDVASDVTLDRLHELLQTTMGWQNCHMHLFHLSGRRVAGKRDPETRIEDERKIRLHDVVRSKGATVVYEYDLGDSWYHHIAVTEIGDSAPDHPQCVGGQRHCPPEDCGGSWGYAHLLEVLSDPKHREFDELRGWAGEFDPESFDADAINRWFQPRSRRGRVPGDA